MKLAFDAFNRFLSCTITLEGFTFSLGNLLIYFAIMILIVFVCRRIFS